MFVSVGRLPLRNPIEQSHVLVEFRCNILREIRPGHDHYVRSFKDQFAEHQSAHLASRYDFHRLLAFVPGEQHPAECGAQQLFVSVGRLPLRNPIEQSYVLVEFRRNILREIPRPGILGPFDVTVVELEFLQQTADQRGLADTVGPENRNA